jgi:hypothetical protein
MSVYQHYGVVSRYVLQQLDWFRNVTSKVLCYVLCVIALCAVCARSWFELGL